MTDDPSFEFVLATFTPHGGESWFEEQLALQRKRAESFRSAGAVWFEEAPCNERYEVVTFEREGRDPVQFGRLDGFRFVTSPLLIDKSQHGQPWRDQVFVAGKCLGKTAMLRATEVRRGVRAQRPPGRRTAVAMAVDDLLR